MKLLLPLLFSAVALSMSGCSGTSGTGGRLSNGDQVRVNKIPMTIEKKVFDKGLHDPGLALEEHNQYANTHWYFRTRPKFDFEIVEKNSEKGTSRVKLLIKAVDVELALPITIWLPEGANEEVIAHENGHVAICERLYKDANVFASEAARSVVGQTFEGHGDSLQAACQLALNKASLLLARRYSEKTVDVVNQVSQYYDQLTPQHPEPKYVSSSVDAAFQLHERVLKAGGDIRKAFPEKPASDKTKAK